MTTGQDMQVALDRAVLFALGGCAALALWALGEHWGSPALPPALYLALFCLVAVHSAVALALAGPVPARRALAGALLLALPVTALVSLAGQRHAAATDLLDDPVTLTVVAVLVVVATPFLSVWQCRRRDWLNYAALFETAWTIILRYALAWVFVAVFCLLAVLSDALLQLVQIGVIDQVLRTGWLRFALTGAMLGLGLAVVYELRETLAPLVVLRLLRLLLPVVLVVVAVFLAAIPLRGLSRLFGDLSAAAILMGAAIAAITLISTALDRSDAEAVKTRGLRLATRGLALLLPLLTGLAVVAVAIRVRQYGWTPDRLLAACAALFLLVYAVGYCGAALWRRGWAGRIRRINVAMALAVIAVAALWLTPVLNVYRISAASQLARFADGRSGLDQLPLWQLAHDWGRAGQAALDRAQAMQDRADHAELSARIAAVRSQPDPFRFEQAIRRRQAPASAAELARLMAVRPAGASLTVAAFAGLPFYRLDQWLEGCRRPLPDGRAGCVLVRGGFVPAVGAQEQGMVLYLDGTGHGRANHVLLGTDARIVVRDVFDPVTGTWPVLPERVVAQALDGDFEIRPSGARALVIGDVTLVPEN